MVSFSGLKISFSGVTGLSSGIMALFSKVQYLRAVLPLIVGSYVSILAALEHWSIVFAC